MYQEEIADLTAEHLRSHMQEYLDAVKAIYADKIEMTFPKAIETANLVGGVYNATQKAMPAYAVDIIDKVFTEHSDNLWLYQYNGHIAGVISASNEDSANKIVKRHEQATEMFVKRHDHFHQTAAKKVGNDFLIVGLGFTGAAFSGAEKIDEAENRETWIAGFRIDLVWIVSEDGPGDHA
jgi:hypothetical protein